MNKRYNFFEAVYNKLLKCYNRTASVYVSLVVEKPFSFILVYLSVACLLSLGLFQVKFNLDTDALAIVRNSDSMHNAALLNKTFVTNQNERHYNNKLLDLGCYFEMIINVKLANTTRRASNLDLLRDEYNFLTPGILNEYNKLFDAVVALEIQDETRRYAYADLCARRMNKCSVEGGIMRRDAFQTRLLNHEIGYPVDDNKHTYVDSTEMDALSVNLIFGVYRKEIIIDEEVNGGKLATVHTGTIRNRFDLLYSTEQNRSLSMRYMRKFTQFMRDIQLNNTYPHLNISYFTSHSLTDEIETYSKADTNYVLVSFFFFWLTMLISMTIAPEKSHTTRHASSVSGSNLSSSSSSTLKSYLASASNTFNLNAILTNGAWYLTFVCFFQIVITFTASFGLLSFLGVRVNFLTATIVFILVLTSCNQAYLLYVNITLWNIERNDLDDSMLDEDQDENQYEIYGTSGPLSKAAKKILVPNLFTVVASILTYFFIGITSSFDSIRVYCIFTNFCLALNFFGQLTFYFPCLVLHLRRVNSGRNCFTFQYSKTNKTINTNTTDIKETSDLNEPSTQLATTRETDIEVDLLRSTNTHKTRTQRQTSAQLRFQHGVYYYSDKLRKISVFKSLFDSKLKYLLFLVFILYFIANSIVCHARFHTNLPITDLIPSKSFLKVHMINHMTLFNIGPIVTIAFMQPLAYWNKSVFTKIRLFLDDCKKLDGMDPLLEINWLNDTYSNGKLKEIFFEQCQDPLNYECFRDTFRETVYDAEFYRDDAVFVDTKNKTLEIKASRVYLQMKNFSGTLDEVNLMHNLRQLAKTRYNFSEQDVIIFSPVFIFLEQLEEIIPAMVSVFLLNFESVLLASLFLLFDFRTLVIQLIVMISLLLSIISSAVIFNLTLNIVTLYHFLLLPALICEFIFNIPYFFLFKASALRKEQAESGQANENELTAESTIKFKTSTNKLESASGTPSFNLHTYKLKQLEFAYEHYIKPVSFYVLVIVMLNFSIMYSCTTYNFQTLYLFLMSFSFNLFLHLFFFYPNLLILFGTCWIKDLNVNSFDKKKKPSTTAATVTATSSSARPTTSSNSKQDLNNTDNLVINV